MWIICGLKAYKQKDLRQISFFLQSSYNKDYT